MRVIPSPVILVPLLQDNPDFSALASPDSWREIQEVAVARRMAALVAYAVRSHASPEQRAWCDKVLTESWTRHDQNIRELDAVLKILDDAGIEVLVLKGPILGRRHFQPPFLRRSSADTDLAVRNVDLERAAAELTKWGYKATSSIASVQRTSHHLVMVGSGTRNVELHTRLSHQTLGIPVDALFERASRHVLPTGRTARIQCEEDELLGLLLHFGNDRFSSFFHLYELRRIWWRTGIETQRSIVRRAVAGRFRAVLWLTNVAFQTYWSESFLSEDISFPAPWLQSRLTSEFLHAMESNTLNFRERTLTLRLTGRWLDLHVTDTRADALRWLGLAMKVAIREFMSLRWGTIEMKSPKRLV